MCLQALTYSTVPDDLPNLLTSHLPYSLPLLRRLQFAKYKGRTTPHARTIVVTHHASLDDLTDDDPFTAVYADFSGGPETQMWLFSTLETVAEGLVGEKEDYTQQLKVLVSEMVRLGGEYGRETTHPGALLLGTLHTRVRRILESMQKVTPRATGYYDKWLFKASELPSRDAQLPEGMIWDVASLSDCEIVVSRTDIPRTAETLSRLPNLLIRLADGTPISWAFLGSDGSLMSLHCEVQALIDDCKLQLTVVQEPYRRRGLAKALAAKLMRLGPGDFASDGWCSADVAGDNLGSRGMCKSLNGTPHWEVSWVLFDITG